MGLAYLKKLQYNQKIGCKTRTGSFRLTGSTELHQDLGPKEFASLNNFFICYSKIRTWNSIHNFFQTKVEQCFEILSVPVRCAAAATYCCCKKQILLLCSTFEASRIG